jgi:hypothetical protein
MIEFLAQMPTNTMIFLTMAVLSLAATPIPDLRPCTHQRADRSPVVGSCFQIKQGCAGCCPDCKQNCPCRRTSSRREPWSRFAFGLLFARFAWFDSSFDPFQAHIECDHL